jgi:hypothetical protein
VASGAVETFLSKAGYGERVAAAEAEVRVARDGVELLFGVAECLSYGAGIGGLISLSEGAIVVLNSLVDVTRIHCAENGVEVLFRLSSAQEVYQQSTSKSYCLYMAYRC